MILANPSTINLQQLLATLNRPWGARSQIVVDVLTLPSDLWALHSRPRMRGMEEPYLKLVPPR